MTVTTVRWPLASRWFNLEAAVSGDELDHDGSNASLADLHQVGLGVDLLLMLHRGSFQPFLLVGGGGLSTEVRTQPAHRDAGFMANAGLGALIGLGDRVSLRVEGRYRWDDNNGELYNEEDFGDWIGAIGLQIALGGKAAAAATAAALPPPVPPAPAAAPAPADTDGDSVPDSADQCPNTPAGAKVDGDGCEIKADTDGDGVPDEKDLCPTTPAGTKVTATGCSEAAILHGVKFKTGSAVLLPESKELLDKAGRVLRDNPELKVFVDGHTDNTGSAAVNKQLSQKRADAVKQYFVTETGIDPSRLTTRGWGEDHPIADNKTADGRSLNRRVELNPTK
jgi:OOP family OmpA-OmpF porin